MEPEETQQASSQSSTSDDSVESMAVGSYVLETLRSRHGDYEVWTAVHRPTDMEVVMDVYPKTGDDKKLVESVVHKIDLFTSLADAKVLRLLEVMDSSVGIFLVYEHYSSQSLLHYILNCPLGGKEFHRLVRSLVKIVQGLHRHCFFHGTLSAESFVLTRQRKIRFKDAPSCHAFVRSQAEPARFDAMLSKASDVWSLGALIYRLISHQQSSSGRQLGASVGTAAETVAEFVAKQDAELSDLLARMTDQNPTARISTADCLRHPYLTRWVGLPPTRRWAPNRNRGRINLDVVRFLSRATGAPVPDLAAAADANDLSGWCAAYWLMKQRLAAGRGYPSLGTNGDDEDSDGGDGDGDRKHSQTPAANRQEPQQKTREATMGQRATKASALESSGGASGDAGYRKTIALLRGRRLGLASPRGTESATQVTGEAPSLVEAKRGARLPRPPDQQRDSLPPITVRSAGNSEQRTQRSGSERQQLATDRRRQLAATRYLAYIRGQEEAGGDAATVEEPVAAPAAYDDSADASSAIRVRVQQRRREVVQASSPPRRQSLQPQRRHVNQPATMPAPSPRQPPNSRTDLGRPTNPAYAQSTARPDDEARVDVHEGAAPPASADAEATPPFLWENAVVRWQPWSRSRAVCF